MNENQKPKSYRDLLVWQKGIELAKLIYALTAKFPVDEKFGLVSQLRRAAVSIPSNIAEGQARHTTGAFIQFVSNAEGSVAEVDTQLVLAVELNLVGGDLTADSARIVGELSRMLKSLRAKLELRRDA